MEFSVALFFIALIGFVIIHDAIERHEEHFLLYGVVLFIAGLVGSLVTAIISLSID